VSASKSKEIAEASFEAYWNSLWRIKHWKCKVSLSDFNSQTCSQLLLQSLTPTNIT